MQKGVSKFTGLSIGVAATGFIILLIMIFLFSPYQKDITSEGNMLQVNFLNIIGFYVGLFLFFFGIFTNIFFKFKIRIKNFKEIYIPAVSSIRQGVLMGFLICILLLLQSYKILIWWDALLVVVALVLIEMYLSVEK